jgi:hypothetical protein
VAPARWRGPALPAALPGPAQGHPGGGPAAGGTAARDPQPGPGGGRVAEHGAAGLRAAPGRGLRHGSHRLGHLRGRQPAGGTGSGAAAHRRQRGPQSRPGAHARRLGPGTAHAGPGTPVGGVVGHAAPAPGLRLPLRRAGLRRPAARDLVPAAGPEGASGQRGAAGLRRSRRRPGAAQRTGRLPAPCARRGLHAGADPGHPRQPAGHRSGGACIDRSRRSGRPGGAPLHGILPPAERLRRRARLHSRGRAGTVRRRADRAARGARRLRHAVTSVPDGRRALAGAAAGAAVVGRAPRRLHPGGRLRR